MARGKSLGRCTQLPGGYDTRAEDHNHGYGQQHLFNHWTLLLGRNALFRFSHLPDDSLERATQKNPNKHRRVGNKKISDLRSDGSIVEPPALIHLRSRSAGHSAQKESAEVSSPPRSMFFSCRESWINCPGWPAAQCRSCAGIRPFGRIRRHRG
jgi:hypothetical protein